MRKARLNRGQIFPLLAGAIFICTLSTTARGQDTGDGTRWERLDQAQIEEVQTLKKTEVREKNIEHLQLAKYALISGNWDLAEAQIKKVASVGHSPEIAERYLALLRFLQGKYAESANIIEPKLLFSSTFLRENCLIYQLSLIALGDKSKLPLIWYNCRRELIEESPSDFLFVDSLFGINQSDPHWEEGHFFNSIAPFIQNDEQIKIWLKMGLILGREKEMEKELSQLPDQSFLKDKVRELMGIVLFRLGRTEDALKFVEDIKTPNAENLRAISYLKNKQYEMAYAEFQNVLGQKANSLQALNRALPLAWLLKQDQSGLELARQVPELSGDGQVKSVLTAAILNRLGRPEESMNHLQQIFKGQKAQASFLSRSLGVLNTLQTENNSMARDWARENCKRADALSCWTLLQFLQWENFPKVLGRPNPAWETSPWMSYDALLNKARAHKFNEEVFIEQRRLNEMDLGVFHLGDDLAPYSKEDLLTP